MAEKYTIENVMKRTTLDRAGQVIPIYEVIFVTITGARDAIEFSETDFTEANVKKVVTEKAELLNKIMTL